MPLNPPSSEPASPSTALTSQPVPAPPTPPHLLALLWRQGGQVRSSGCAATSSNRAGGGTRAHSPGGQQALQQLQLGHAHLLGGLLLLLGVQARRPPSLRSCHSGGGRGGQLARRFWQCSYRSGCRGSSCGGFGSCPGLHPSIAVPHPTFQTFIAVRVGVTKLRSGELRVKVRLRGQQPASGGRDEIGQQGAW
jgi:hypothetical protein